MPKLLPSLLLSPGGERIYDFLLQLSTYTLRHLTRRDHTSCSHLRAALSARSHPHSNTLIAHPPAPALALALGTNRDTQSALAIAVIAPQDAPGSEELYNLRRPEYVKVGTRTGRSGMHEGATSKECARGVLRAADRLLNAQIARLSNEFVSENQVIDECLERWQPQIE